MSATMLFEEVQVSEDEGLVALHGVKVDTDPFPTVEGKIEYIKYVGMPREWYSKVQQGVAYEMRLQSCQDNPDALAELEAEIVDAYNKRRQERGYYE